MRIDVRTVGLFEENCYLVVDDATKRAVLVDPGDDGEEIVKMVRAAGAELEAIWLTHAHLDHIGAINEVRRSFPVPVHLHPLDLPFYERLSAHAAEMYGIPWDQPLVAPLPVAEGDVMTVGALSFTVMHVPGHAAGHVSFNGHDVALSGDLLFLGSIGRTDLPLSDPYAMDASLARFATLPAPTVVYPGHGPSTTIAAELETNPFFSGARAAHQAMSVRAAPLAIWSLVLLAAWLGAALLVAAVVAPAAFAVLPSRTLAGALVGRVLPALFWGGMFLGVVLAMLGRAMEAGWLATGAMVSLAAACAIAQLYIAPRIETLRRAIGGPVDALDPSDPRRQAFGRLHGFSVLWMGVGWLAAAVALIVLARMLSARR